MTIHDEYRNTMVSFETSADKVLEMLTIYLEYAECLDHERLESLYPAFKKKAERWPTKSDNQFAEIWGQSTTEHLEQLREFSVAWNNQLRELAKYGIGPNPSETLAHPHDQRKHKTLPNTFREMIDTLWETADSGRAIRSRYTRFVVATKKKDRMLERMAMELARWNFQELAHTGVLGIVDFLEEAEKQL